MHGPTSEAVLTDYLQRGGNFVDTANGYTNGHSEKIIGDYFTARPGLRDRVVLSTKFLTNLFPGDPNGGGGGRKGIIGQLDESLRRLQTDYVDLYWLHGWDQGAPLEETLRALDDAVRAGKVRYIGFSDVPAWVAARAQTLAEANGWTPITALQLEYSLLERTPEGELLPMAEALGIGALPWSPLRGGRLSGKYTRDGGREGGRTEVMAAVFGEAGEHEWQTIDAVARVAAELGVSSAEVALTWIRGRPAISSTLIGARTIDGVSSPPRAPLPRSVRPGDEHGRSRAVLTDPHKYIYLSYDLPTSFQEGREVSEPDYFHRYPNFALSRDDQGVLLVRIHTDEGPVVFTGQIHRELPLLLEDIGLDGDNRAMVLTGTGDTFMAEVDGPTLGEIMKPWVYLSTIRREKSRTYTRLLGLPIPVVAVANGPAIMHTELLLLCDLHIASERATYGDVGHPAAGVPSGDGNHVVWEGIVGTARAKWLMWSGETIDAQTALEWGVVSEVLPHDEALDRGLQLARSLAKMPPSYLALQKETLNLDQRRRLDAYLDIGAAFQALALADLPYRDAPAADGAETWTIENDGSMGRS